MTVRGALLDLEGVLYQADAPIAGAREALDRLGADGVVLRYLTNTTTKPRGEVVGRMRAMGFALDLDEVFSPAMAAVAVLRREGLTRVHLAAPAGLAEDFAGFDRSAVRLVEFAGHSDSTQCEDARRPRRRTHVLCRADANAYAQTHDESEHNQPPADSRARDESPNGNRISVRRHQAADPFPAERLESHIMLLGALTPALYLARSEPGCIGNSQS